MTESPPNLESLVCPLPLPHNEKIVLGHGSGGRMSYDLIAKTFFPAFDNPLLQAGDDAATVILKSENNPSGVRLAISTDSHVVQPLFFPGGDIGRLAVCGTVNDVSMLGAIPRYLTAGFVLEEGLPVEILKKVIASMQAAALEAHVQVIAGDTKVVQNGKADGLYINTTGIGEIPPGVDISGRRARPGDAILISGTMGDHGIAVLAARGELSFETQLVSDVAPLNHLVQTMLDVTKEIHVLRDPTRGGLATSLNEIAIQAQVGMLIDEKTLPVGPEVQAACEMLGFDPLYIANEGKLIAIVEHSFASEILAAMRNHPQGKEAAIIGRVTENCEPRVRLKTSFGTLRVVDMLPGEMLPRIC